MTGLDLKVERVKRGVKQLQLSRATGINPTRLSKIENGWTEARAEEVLVICKELRIDRTNVRQET